MTKQTKVVVIGVVAVLCMAPWVAAAIIVEEAVTLFVVASAVIVVGSMTAVALEK